MASGIYQRFFANLMNKEVDLEGDTIKLMLLDNSHSFTATDNTKSQIDTNEIASGSGIDYVAGGYALASKSVTQGDPTYFDAADLEITDFTGTFYHAALYDDTLTNDDLICSFDLGGEQTVTEVTVRFVWDSNGIITMTEA